MDKLKNIPVVEDPDTVHIHVSHVQEAGPVQAVAPGTLL